MPGMPEPLYYLREARREELPLGRQERRKQRGFRQRKADEGAPEGL